MNLNLRSMALAMPRVHAHPNRLAFRGILTLVDSPSDRPPSGARSHRVVLTRAAAERALPSLLGMGLDFTSGFDGHDARRKVGIITSAEIVPISGETSAPPWKSTALAVRNKPNASGAVAPARVEQAFRPAVKGRQGKASAAEVQSSKLETGNSKLVVEGFIFARDFPDVVRELRAHQHSLGMSYEITGARVADPAAKIWKLTEATFTGAAVLRRDKAAYSQTSIELLEPQSSVVSRQSSGKTQRPDACRLTTVDSPKEKKMNEELTQQFLTSASRLAAAAESLEQALSQLDSGNDAVAGKIDRIIAAVEVDASSPRITQLEARIAELERTNTDLKAQVHMKDTRSARKTLPPLVTSLLAKHGLDSSERVDSAVLDKTLAPLSVEQRIAVKAQMARAGIID